MKLDLWYVTYRYGSFGVCIRYGWTKPKLRTRTRASLDRTTPEEGGSPRPRAFLLSERDPLCRRGSRVNFMKLTLLPRQCIYRKVDRVTTKGWKVAGSKPGTHRELCGATPMVLSHSAHVSTRRPKATKCHCSTAGQSQSFAREPELR